MKFKIILLVLMCAGTMATSDVTKRCKRKEIRDRLEEIASSFCHWYKIKMNARHQKASNDNVSKEVALNEEKLKRDYEHYWRGIEEVDPVILSQLNETLSRWIQKYEKTHVQHPRYMSKKTDFTSTAVDLKSTDLDHGARKRRLAKYPKVNRVYGQMSPFFRGSHGKRFSSVKSAKHFFKRQHQNNFSRVKREALYDFFEENNAEKNDTSFDNGFWDAIFYGVPATNTENPSGLFDTESFFSSDHDANQEGTIPESQLDLYGAEVLPASEIPSSVESHESNHPQEHRTLEDKQTTSKPSPATDNHNPEMVDYPHATTDDWMLLTTPEDHSPLDTESVTDFIKYLERISGFEEAQKPEESNHKEDIFEKIEPVHPEENLSKPVHDADRETSFWLKSMMGIPGLNFPNYHDIPLTSFTCSRKKLPGFYADMESACQVFHVCYQDRRESFLCPVGTVFNQAVLTCDFWHRSNCSLTNYYIQTENEVFPIRKTALQENSTSKSVSEVPAEQVSASSEYVDSSNASKNSTSSSAVSNDKPIPTTDLKFFSRFLPIKAKVTIYPAAGDKRAKVEAVASIGHRSRGKKRRPTAPGFHQKIRVSSRQNGIDPDVNKIIRDAFEIVRQVLEESGSLFPPRRPSTRSPKVAASTVGPKRPTVPASTDDSNRPRPAVPASTVGSNRPRPAVPASTVGSKKPVIPKSLPTLNPRFIIQPVYPKSDTRKELKPSSYLLDDHFEIRKD